MQRMKMEIARAKRVAEHFSEQVEKGKNLKKLEEKVCIVLFIFLLLLTTALLLGSSVAKPS